MNKRNFLLLLIWGIVSITILFESCKKEAEKIEPVVTNLDTIKPVITLRASVICNIVFCSNWIDPGFIATDNIDGDITTRVTITGTVNNISAGLYNLEYNVKDMAGNSAVPVLRKVTVDAAPFLAGSYSVVDFYNGYFSHYTDNISASTTLKNSIKFYKFADYMNAQINATLSGTNLTIPNQVIHCGIPPGDVDHTFQGTGTFTTSCKIDITYSDSSSFGNIHNCTGTYTKL